MKKKRAEQKHAKARREVIRARKLTSRLERQRHGRNKHMATKRARTGRRGLLRTAPGRADVSAPGSVERALDALQAAGAVQRAPEDAPDKGCLTRADGECVSEGPCMHSAPAPPRTCPKCGAAEVSDGVTTNLAPYSGLCIDCLNNIVAAPPVPDAEPEPPEPFLGGSRRFW